MANETSDVVWIFYFSKEINRVVIGTAGEEYGLGWVNWWVDRVGWVLVGSSLLLEGAEKLEGGRKEKLWYR